MTKGRCISARGPLLVCCARVDTRPASEPTATNVIMPTAFLGWGHRAGVPPGSLATPVWGSPGRDVPPLMGGRRVDWRGCQSTTPPMSAACDRRRSRDAQGGGVPLVGPRSFIARHTAVSWSARRPPPAPRALCHASRSGSSHRGLLHRCWTSRTSQQSPLKAHGGAGVGRRSERGEHGGGRVPTSCLSEVWHAPACADTCRQVCGAAQRK